MFGSETLDLAVGMVFVFLMLSLVASAIREAIEARLKARSMHLAHGLLEMLGSDPDLLAKLYRHPLVSALYDGEYDASIIHYQGHRGFSWITDLIGSFFGKATNMPSYIPARTFALAMVDLARTNQLVTPTGSPPDVAPAALLDDLRAALSSAPSPALAPGGAGQPVVGAAAQGLLAVLAPVGNDVEKGLLAIQDWYDAAMDRVSGWFKRDTQHILFWLGVAVAASLNVDTIGLAKYLASDRDARSSLAQAAADGAKDAGIAAAVKEEAAAELDARKARTTRGAPASDAAKAADEGIEQADAQMRLAVRKVTDLGLPIGWTGMRWDDLMAHKERWVLTIVGWLVTAFGISFGAPFWFDLLNRLMVIRSTVKPHEKSPEEKSTEAGR